MTNTVDTFFDFNEGTDFFQLSNDCLTSFKTVHACKFEGQVIHGSVVVHDVDLWQVVALSNQEVVWIVGRRDFHDTCTKLRICVFVPNDWDEFISDWKDDIFTDQVLVAWVFWIDRNSNVSKHSFRTSSGNFKGA